MWPFSPNPCIEVARRKQAQRDDAIRDARAALRARDHDHDQAGLNAYLRATAQEIVHRISKGEWTASDVLDAYIARALLAQDVTNCLTEVLFAEARAQAKALDLEFAQTGKIRGPLHGVPVTFKDTYDIKGRDSTLGFSSHADAPRAEDALVVKLVREAGGIPLCKTNNSQLLFFFECSNPVWGRTLNPYSKSYSSGGTSGGEAALLAMDGAALGWGTDIGGSLRIPASFCGIYSLKPGWSRISMTGVQGTWPGFEAVRTVAGPMGRSVDDIELGARLVFGKQGDEYDPAPLPYRTPEMPKKLRFGYYLSDNFVKPSPACQRAVREAAEALRKAGHECIEFELPCAQRAMELFIGITAADKYKTLSAELNGDPMELGVMPLVYGPRLPGWLRNGVAWLLNKVYKDDVYPSTVRAASGKPVEEFHRWVKQRDEFVRMFYREIWDKYGFDGIIAPVLATPGLPHNSVQYLLGLACTDLLYNLVESPVGTVPVTRVRTSTDFLTAEHTDPRVGPGHGSPFIEGLLYRGDGFYDAEKMDGLPVGVQVVGRRWEDEKVVEMMRVLDDALGPRGFGPLSWTGQGK
ncbi:amidase signature enzyme [Trametes coccinea BRFM310]|uniref:amidase n=1 Tax=Trametes coccinea (strain BRFM310) TaxID=1353009 RepID=A0A1Y2IPN1_TRAC3|nr:amidase signature enzyme [Trametes coccinea BRFM310]